MRDTKLTRAQELEICQLWAGGMTQSALCKKYHIGMIRLWQIIDRHNAKKLRNRKRTCRDRKRQEEFSGLDVVTAAMR